MEEYRCSKCLEVYPTTEKACPKCGSTERTSISFPDPVWED